jgi:hypothetical protein
LEELPFKRAEFPVDKPFWDLWNLLEERGVREVFIETWRESSHPEVIDVYTYKDVANLFFPAWILASINAYKVITLFAETYTYFHTDVARGLKREIRSIIRNLAGEAEPPGKLREVSRRLYEEVIKRLKELMRELDTFAVFSRSPADIAREELKWLKGG